MIESVTDAAAFLAAIRAAPDDDAPRLVYADWLDEHGEADRAEFVRVQCELAKLDDWRCERCGGSLDDLAGREGPCIDCDYPLLAKRAALRRRERELLIGPHPPDWNWVRWLGGPFRGRSTCQNLRAPDHLEDPTVPSVTFRRGFVGEVTCPAADWRAHADAILARHPVTAVRLTTRPEFDRLVHVPGGAVHVQVSGTANGLTEPADSNRYTNEATYTPALQGIGATAREAVKDALEKEPTWKGITFHLPGPASPGRTSIQQIIEDITERVLDRIRGPEAVPFRHHGGTTTH